MGAILGETFSNRADVDEVIRLHDYPVGRYVEGHALPYAIGQVAVGIIKADESVS